MMIDDHMVMDYLCGRNMKAYRDCWIFHSFGNGSVFELPDQRHRARAAKLQDQLKAQLLSFQPRSSTVIKMLFPNFDRIAADCLVLLVVGFPAPYDAVTLEHDGKEYVIFDLLRFGEDAANAEDRCRKLLTHELIHLCLHEYYPVPEGLSYLEALSYTAFDEGFAHALSYGVDLSEPVFNDFLSGKLDTAKETLRRAVGETDPVHQAQYRKAADTGSYWDKFASIAGKLYILKNIGTVEKTFYHGWYDFADKILLPQE